MSETRNANSIERGCDDPQGASLPTNAMKIAETLPVDAPSEDAINILRSETALSRFPIHRLANRGIVNIEIRRKDAQGSVTFLWEVSHNSRYGQPGPLAYKLDTLVINRRIDEAGRPVPKLLRLGSLAEIARELELGADTNKVKRALRQNAFAGITAKTAYRALDGSQRSFEFSDTRYGLILTGERLPSGAKADAVYLIFHDLYLEVLNNAPRRPLDYDYLRDLSPAPQRFYEIISYEIFPAIKFGHRAKLPYSEFCEYSTLTRYFEFEQVKKQMYKIHLPHIKAGYISRVEYETTTDKEGEADWNMLYTPGEKARFQQLVFDFGIISGRKERMFRSKPSPQKSGTVAPRALPLELPLSPVEPPSNQKAISLVKHFYKKRYGQEQPPSSREIAEAEQYLAEDETWAHFLIEFTSKQGKEKDGFPNDFGGVKKLVAQAREPYDAKRKQKEVISLKKTRQSHLEAHQSAYHAFLGELLGGRLESSLPEAFRVFTEQEERTRRFYRVRAHKSERAAESLADFDREAVRIARLLAFIDQNPKCGIPDFWQWDEKINQTPFASQPHD